MECPGLPESVGEFIGLGIACAKCDAGNERTDLRRIVEPEPERAEHPCSRLERGPADG
jgi:hypothetical protein